MSRALKIIDALILTAFIVIGLALMLPRAFGINVTVSDPDLAGNVPVGTTVYSRQIAGTGLVSQDQIVVQTGGELNIYTIEAVDTEAKTMDVSGNLAGEVVTYNIPNAAQKIIRTVPLIGYLLLMVKDTKGLIMLAALLAVVIFLFIISEIIRGDDEEDEEDDLPGYRDDDDDDFYRRLAEQKQARDNHKSITDSLPAPEINRTGGGFREEKAEPEWGDRESGLTELFREDTEEQEPADENLPMQPPAVDDMGIDALPNVQAALEAALESQPLNRREEARMPLPEAPAEEEVVPNENGEIELAIPVYSADELLQKAYADGLDPTVKEDRSGITLVDYSDCI